MNARSSIVSMIAAATLMLVAGVAQGQTTASGPYYATPSWDQQLPASTRFIVLSNWVDGNFPAGGAAVLDRETGLVWERSPDPTVHTWYNQSIHCLDSNTGGRTGWRLPTIQELLSLVDRSRANPALPTGHPFINVQPSLYWSATTYAQVTSGAYIVYMPLGRVQVGEFKAANTYLAWCVRGGHGVDPQ